MKPIIALPKIRGVYLEGFSLYNLQPSINLGISDGVFCLAGANGLGKSTFLSALNYGLTGIVRDPKRSFQAASFDEYYRDSIQYSNEFFTGRIVETDRDIASVGVDFELSDYRFRIVRALFAPQELQQVTITKLDTEETIIDGVLLSPSQRHVEYAKHLVEKVGVGTFSQYAFLQLFIFTFDESRTLAFWDQRVLNRALSLCFGVSSHRVERADNLHREMEKAGSLARNANWQATVVQNEIRAIQRQLTLTAQSAPEDENGERVKHLQESIARSQQEVINTQLQIDDDQLALMQLSADLAQLESEYEGVFREYVDGGVGRFNHPLVVASISENRCQVCGTDGIADVLNHDLSENSCPLCGTHIDPAETRGENVAQLEHLDTLISNVKEQVASRKQAINRLQNEILATKSDLGTFERELAHLEQKNEHTFYSLRAASAGLESALQIKAEELKQHLRRKETKYAERDQKKFEFLEIQREIHDKYTNAESVFVPLFKDLAVLFLGMDLDIRGEFNTSMSNLGFTISLEVRGQMRREAHQLSESQRFFIDIALRMALAQYTTGDIGGATLFIDTPEGSLDIAYETRAGQMFAKFANAGHNIIMTANINSSQILKKLARECGGKRMTLHRMTTWTELTEVQMNEPLLEAAYVDIERILDSRN